MELLTILVAGGIGIVIGCITGYVLGFDNGFAKGKKHATGVMRELKKQVDLEEYN